MGRQHNCRCACMLAGLPVQRLCHPRPCCCDALPQDGEVRRAFQRSLQKQGLKFKLSTKVRKW